MFGTLFVYRLAVCSEFTYLIVTGLKAVDTALY